MTPYQRIVSYLDDDIGRADLKAAGVYDRRIQRSLAKYHRKEFWQRDIVDSDPILFPAPYAAVQQIDLRNLPRFRKLAYMRDYDPNATYVDPTNQVKIGVAGPDYDEISLPFGTDYFGYDKNYVFYRAGEVVNLRSRGQIKAVLVGYFVDPLVEPVASINSWLADLYPELIACDVKVRIFSDIGKDAEAKGARDERADFEMTLFANNLYTSTKKG